jgi:hypothetical protein
MRFVDPNDGPGDHFEKHPGQLFTISEADVYAGMRYTLYSKGYMKPNTLQGVEMAHRELDDMLQLGIRSLHFNQRFSMIFSSDIPILKLRLDQDAQGFSFLKSWKEHALDEMSFNFEHESSPYDQIVHENERIDIGVCFAVLLLRLKLLIDIRNLRVARRILQRTTLPGEICRLIELRSPLTRQLLDDPPEVLAKKETNLLSDVRVISLRPNTNPPSTRTSSIQTDASSCKRNLTAPDSTTLALPRYSMSCTPSSGSWRAPSTCSRAPAPSLGWQTSRRIPRGPFAGLRGTTWVAVAASMSCSRSGQSLQGS